MRLRLGLIMLFTLVFASAANAGLLVDKRLGNNTEGATTITNGRYANQIAVIDGYDVIAIPTKGGEGDGQSNERGDGQRDGQRSPHKLFDVKSIHWGAFPSGIAYIPTERSFVFDDQGDLTDLQVTSETGAVQPPRPITFLADYPADAIGAAEGLAYLPRSSPWPDAIARAAWFPGEANPAHIEILSRAASVLKEIPVPLPPDEAYITGLAYLGKDGFLISTADNNMWRVTVDGIATGPINVPEAAGIEGLALMPNGHVYAADYALGKLLAFDTTLQRDPSGDRAYPIGVGLTRSSDGFWDPATNNWVLMGLDRDHLQTTVAAVSPSLDTRTTLFHISASTSGLADGPGGTVATCPFSAPEVDVYSRAGLLVSTINFATVAGMPARRCQTLAYLPGLDAYAVKVTARANRAKIFVVSRSGILLRTITTGGASVFALSRPPGQSTTLDVWEAFAGLYATYDAANGSLLSTTPVDPTPLLEPGGFIAGPNGSYALLDGNASEMAVFG